MKMMVLIFLAMGAAAWAQPSSISYELGQKLSENSLVFIPKQHCLTAPGKVEPCMRVRSGGVIYTIGYRSKGKMVTYIETHDPAFATASGLRVGSSLEGATGTLVWMNDFGEVAGPDTRDEWQPIVAREHAIKCGNGNNFYLTSQMSRNPEPCPVRILGFKKRAYDTQVKGAPKAVEEIGQ